MVPLKTAKPNSPLTSGQEISRIRTKLFSKAAGKPPAALQEFSEIWA
jgi:hypothetical protein